MTTTKKNTPAVNNSVVNNPVANNAKKYVLDFKSTTNNKFLHVFEPHSVVLCKTDNNGTTRYMYITGLKNYENLTIIKHLLFAYAVEFRKAVKEQEEAKNFTFEGTAYKSENEPLYSMMKPFFNTSCIYTTDKNGLLSEAIKCECDGSTLCEDGFKVRKNDSVATCDYKDLKAYIHNKAKTIQSHLTWVKDLNTAINEVATGSTEEPTTAPTETTTEDKPAKPAKPAPTLESVTAKVA